MARRAKPKVRIFRDRKHKDQITLVIGTNTRVYLSGNSGAHVSHSTVSDGRTWGDVLASWVDEYAEEKVVVEAD